MVPYQIETGYFKWKVTYIHRDSEESFEIWADRNIYVNYKVNMFMLTLWLTSGKRHRLPVSCKHYRLQVSCKR
jgi:hypothetical protein